MDKHERLKQEHPGLWSDWQEVTSGNETWYTLNKKPGRSAEVFVGKKKNGEMHYSWNKWLTCVEKGRVYLTESEIALYRLSYELEERGT